MIYTEYAGNDTYEYTLSSGKNIVLSDEDLEEIIQARKSQNSKGFRSNSLLNLIQLEEIEDEV